eukprot:1173775-Amphidinium_carterae.2
MFSGCGLDNTPAAFEQVGICSAGEVFGVPHRRSGDTRSAYPACRGNSGWSSKELYAPLCGDEDWLTEGPSGEVASDCLQEDLSSCDDEDFSWEASEPTTCPIKLFKRAVSPQSRRSGTSTCIW